mmetsp:Transcript_62191/g.176710  ORF Transcript_62191/g.176710 Transcript_62191/m.176710 type:complete len:238 (+) Transcript_62191:555-1268(+)
MVCALGRRSATTATWTPVTGARLLALQSQGTSAQATRPVPPSAATGGARGPKAATTATSRTGTAARTPVRLRQASPVRVGPHTSRTPAAPSAATGSASARRSATTGTRQTVTGAPRRAQWSLASRATAGARALETSASGRPAAMALWRARRSAMTSTRLEGTAALQPARPSRGCPRRRWISASPLRCFRCHRPAGYTTGPPTKQRRTRHTICNTRPSLATCTTQRMLASVFVFITAF